MVHKVFFKYVNKFPLFHPETDHSYWIPPEESFKPRIPMTVYDDPGIYLRLYNIVTDPEEKNNVALTNMHIVFKLLHRLAYYSENIVNPEYLYSDPAGRPSKRRGEMLAWKPWRT